jgi:Alginate export
MFLPRAARLIGAAAFAIIALHTALTNAQTASPPDGVSVGEFWFRPRVEIRPRAEYYHHPVGTTGIELPVLGSTLTTPQTMSHQWVVSSRSRLGLSVERGFLVGNIVIQDARLAGLPSPAGVDRGEVFSATSFSSAFIELRSLDASPSWARIGRQEITWGEGRLLGASDWALTPRSLDAARLHLTLRQFDFEALAALLAPPGAVPPEYRMQAEASGGLGGTGAQLYGVDAIGHFDPLLHAEVLGLVRIARDPLTATALAPSDTFVLDGRIFGDRAGIAYSVEFAYEAGRIAILGGNRQLSAWGTTAHVDWQTSWLWRPKLVLGGSFATGDAGDLTGKLHRFDPVLPDVRSGLGQMGLYGWTNVLDAAFAVILAPAEGLTVALDYRHVRLADARGAWFAASLAAVGQNPNNDSTLLGNEIDAEVTYAPLDALAVSAGYGALITGDGARTILAGSADAGPPLLSAAFLQLRLTAP